MSEKQNEQNKKKKKMPVTRSMIARHFEIEDPLRTPGHHPAMSYYKCLHCEAQGTRLVYCFAFEEFQDDILNDLLGHLRLAHGVQLQARD